MKFLIVDAFTETLFGGNPAGVVILDKDFPSDETMVKAAAELRYSETAFIQQVNDREFNIRYFTPAAEVDLCGHATIASFVSLLHEGIIKDNESYVNHTLAGDLEIVVKDGFVMMEMATPKKIGEIKDREKIDELYKIMGVSYDESMGLIPQMISTGLPDIMMPVKDQAQLEAISPDFPALSKLSEGYQVVGVHAFTLDAEEGVTAHARNFAPLYDIDEEAATGTSNGALTYYFSLNGIIGSEAQCKIVQGEKMGRPSAILTSLKDGKVKVGGTGRILARGDIDVQ
ncbi:MAG: PhzF family phenazine biosynthesis protein [Clostridia bacterium]|nr:PhzF family phenazine biosynthesis protein [Clostridia bacterium]